MIVRERRGVRRGDADLIPAEPVVGVAGDRHAPRCLFEEGSRIRIETLVATACEQLGDRLRVPGPQVVDAVVTTALPAVAPADRVALDQVRQVDREQDVPVDRALVQVVGDAAPQEPLPLGVAPPEVCREGLADQVVQGQAQRPSGSVKLREASQP